MYLIQAYINYIICVYTCTVHNVFASMFIDSIKIEHVGFVGCETLSHATYSFSYQTALVIGLIPFQALHNPRFLLDKHRWIQIQTSSQGEWSRSWWSSPLPWISVLRSQRVTTLAERHMGWYCMGISWLKHGCVCMSSHCLKSGSSRSTSGITYAWLPL